MPQYYNLSKYSSNVDIMGVYATTDALMKGMFSLFFIVILGTWITFMRIKRNDEPTDAIILGSFYSLMAAIVLYIAGVYYSGITKMGLYIFVPSIILVTASAVKWYNNR